MSENLVAKEIQKQAIDSAVVHLYELETTPGEFFYFSDQNDTDYSVLQFRDYDSPTTIRDYAVIPVKTDGFELKNDGAIPRPSLSIANVSSVLKNAIGNFDYQSLLGLKVVRRTTLKKYLYGESGDANPPVEFPRQVYYVDRIKTRTKLSVEIELVSPFDLENVRIPARVVHADRCSFEYQGASLHHPKYKRAQSGCAWDIESKQEPYTGAFIAYVNLDEEYIVPANTTFTTYSSGSITIDTYYKTTETQTRNNANGTTSSVTVNNYWQATTSTSSPGSPNDSNANFNRIRVFNDYSHGTEYFTYTNDKYNDYVRFTDNVSSSATYNKAQLWKAVKPSQNEVPTSSNAFWEKGDQCAKTTKSCKMRFAAAQKGSDTYTAKAKQLNTVTYPFGGFPAARKFN